VVYLVVTLGFKKPAAVVQKPSETSAAAKAGGEATGEKAGEAASKGATVPAGVTAPAGAEAPSMKGELAAPRLGRPDYKPPEQYGPAPDPFASFMGRGGAQGPGLQAAAPSAPAVQPSWSPPQGVPAPTTGQPAAVVVSPSGVQVTVKPVVARPKSFIESLGKWPEGVPARPSVPRASFPLVLLGTVLGDRSCAIVWDGSRSRIIGEGGSLTIWGSQIVFREIGNGYAQVVYDRRVRTLRLREGS
jgi:hypothetical protein